eukprot:SAG11_NODE_1774_length_4271_cov_4.419942_2_plen_168_part_00
MENTKLHPDQQKQLEQDLIYLNHNSRFTENEVREMAGYAKPTVAREDFAALCVSHGLNEMLTDRLYDTFDISDDGSLTFRELVLTLSRLLRGTVDDLTRVFFEMYDINNDDSVEVDEVSAPSVHASAWGPHAHLRASAHTPLQNIANNCNHRFYKCIQCWRRSIRAI